MQNKLLFKFFEFILCVFYVVYLDPIRSSGPALPIITVGVGPGQLSHCYDHRLDSSHLPHALISGGGVGGGLLSPIHAA